MNTIRARLLSGFLILVLITVSLISLVYFFYDKIERIEKVEDRVDELTVSCTNMMSLDEQFLKDDIENEDFFKNDVSPYLVLRDSLISELFRQLYKTKKDPAIGALDNNFQEMITELEEYNQLYLELLNLYRERGFKDYGVEGEMRHWAHILEDSASLNFKPEWILTLRRHEKDYIIRKDSAYIKRFENYASALIGRLSGQEKYAAGLEILKLYREKFRDLVSLEEKLGIKQNEGKKYELFLKKVSTLQGFGAISRMISRREDKVAGTAKIWVTSVTLLAILISLFISIWLSNRFSKPVQRLSENMNTFLYKDWKADLQLDENIDILELRDLTKSYKKLVRQLKDQFEETKEKSEELDIQNGRLLKLGEEMEDFVKSSSRKLRAPLNSLQGLTELFKLDQLDTKDPKTINMLEQSLRQIENYIKEINEYVDLRKEELNIVEFSAGEIIEKLIQDKSIKNSVRTNLNLEIKPDTLIKNDSKRFELIINHILENAFQYFDRDLNKLNLFVSAKKENGHLLIDIQDDGIGIEKEHLDDVFKMFFRASHFSRGSGLGLYIARASLKTMNGSIHLDSKKGEGTRVRIELPVEPDQA